MCKRERERESERERENLAIIALRVPGYSQPSRHKWQASHPYGLVREPRERERRISHFESVPVGVANPNSVHVEIVESGLLHTMLQHQCFSTPLQKGGERLKLIYTIPIAFGVCSC